MDKKHQFQIIETHLRNYNPYKVAIKNIKETIDEIMPNITTNYTWKEGFGGVFNIVSPTENAVLDRLTSSRTIYLNEQLKVYKTITKSIDEAMNVLNEDERDFVNYRYLSKLTVEITADKLGYSVQNCFKIRSRIKDKLLISLRNLIRMPVDF